MSSALRRRLAALKEMRTDRGCTEHEQAAAQEAIQRLLARLGEADRERHVDRPEPYGPAPGRRRRRDRRPHPGQPVHVGDVIDVQKWCRCGQGHGRYEVLSAIELGHAGLLRCCGCGRNAMWLTRNHFRGSAADLNMAFAR